MTATIVPQKSTFLRSARTTPTDRFCRRLLINTLARLTEDRIDLHHNGDVYQWGAAASDTALSAHVKVNHMKFFSSAVLGGSLGAGEAYMAGHWTSDDLTALIRILIRNQAVLERLDSRWARLSQPIQRVVHWLRKNTLPQSRRNIRAHYDLGNTFYKLFLDDTMTYSCGIFETSASTLKEASLAKYDRICRKLHLSPKDHLLEIGTGWGGFAVHAARHYGCRVTTTTISQNQYRYAARLIHTKGLEDKITLLRRDYRDLRGTFDKLVSIEMIEAVGHQFLPAFFDVCSRRLKPDGQMLLQAITIRDHLFAQHKKSVDFIKRYIFPGSCIPSVAAMSRALARRTDLKITHLEDITPHYAKTLRHWRERFESQRDRVRRLGFSEEFIRMWRFYLSYCEAGFAEQYIGNVQMLLSKPQSQPLPLFSTGRGAMSE